MSEDTLVINKERTITLDLNPEEKSLLDDVQVKSTAPKPKPKPPVPIIRRPITNTDSIEDFMNVQKKAAPQDEVMSFSGSESLSMEAPEDGDFSGDAQPSNGYKSVEDEKADLLNKIERLEKKGFKTSVKVNAYSDIELIRTEYKRIMYHIETDQGVKMARRVLLSCVTGIEFLNKRFAPFDVKLDGWSENMMENIDDYDQVFEELHAKYKDKMEVAPEIKLIMMVGGSAMMFHLSKKMFEGSGIDPSKIMKQNPDFMKNMMESMKQAQQQPGPTTVDPSGRREMRGPGIDFGSLMGGFVPPPPPQNTRPVVREETIVERDSEDDISDIISINSDSVKDVTMKTRKRKGVQDKKVLVL
jgi:hypothetical protein